MVRSLSITRTRNSRPIPGIIRATLDRAGSRLLLNKDRLLEHDALSRLLAKCDSHRVSPRE